MGFNQFNKMHIVGTGVLIGNINGQYYIHTSAQNLGMFDSFYQTFQNFKDLQFF